jgi:hypothetical protein
MLISLAMCACRQSGFNASDNCLDVSAVDAPFQEWAPATEWQDPPVSDSNVVDEWSDSDSYADSPTDGGDGHRGAAASDATTHDATAAASSASACHLLGPQRHPDRCDCDAGASATTDGGHAAAGNAVPLHTPLGYVGASLASIICNSTASSHAWDAQASRVSSRQFLSDLLGDESVVVTAAGVADMARLQSLHPSTVGDSDSAGIGGGAVPQPGAGTHRHAATSDETLSGSTATAMPTQHWQGTQRDNTVGASAGYDGIQYADRHRQPDTAGGSNGRDRFVGDIARSSYRRLTPAVTVAGVGVESSEPSALPRLQMQRTRTTMRSLLSSLGSSAGGALSSSVVVLASIVGGRGATHTAEAAAQPTVPRTDGRGAGASGRLRDSEQPTERSTSYFDDAGGAVDAAADDAGVVVLRVCWRVRASSPVHSDDASAKPPAADSDAAGARVVLRVGAASSASSASDDVLARDAASAFTTDLGGGGDGVHVWELQVPRGRSVSVQDALHCSYYSIALVESYRAVPPLHMCRIVR